MTVKGEPEWRSLIDGKEYHFLCEKMRCGKRLIHVNNEPIVIKARLISQIFDFDEGFVFDGKEARLMGNGNKADVAVDGVFLQSDKKYVATPKWVIIFAFLNALITVFFLGITSFCVSLIGIMSCYNVSRTTRSEKKRFVLCLLITIGLWAIVIHFARSQVRIDQMRQGIF